MKFSNREEWVKNLKDATRRVEKSAEDALDEANTLVVLQSIEYTPTFSGRLAASRRAYIEKERDELTAIVSYNEDGSAPYAIEQHETPDPPYSHDHPWNPQNAQYRFLARAYEMQLQNIRTELKNRIRFK